MKGRREEQKVTWDIKVERELLLGVGGGKGRTGLDPKGMKR